MSAAALVAAAAGCSGSSTQRYSGMVRDGGGSTAAAAFKQGRLAVQPIPPNHTCENLPVVQQQEAARSGGVQWWRAVAVRQWCCEMKTLVRLKLG